MKKITLTSVTVMSAMAMATPALATDTSWTGAYGGLSVGYQDAHVMHDGYTLNYFGLAGTPQPRGVIGGGFAGYNFQVPGRDFVIGGEASIDLGGQKDSAPANAFTQQPRARVPGEAAFKGRVGYTGKAGFMPWLTAGIAVGRTEYELASTPPLAGNHGTQTATGWTAGLGVDYAFQGPLFARVGYSYTYLGQNVFFRDQPGESFGLNDFKFGLGYKF